MDFDFYNWCSNLFAYLYQHYEDTELVDGLPIRMEYEIAETFHRRIGECQVRVNSILRKHLQSVFEKNYLVVCRSVSTFEAYAKRSCLRLSHNFETQISFLGFSAVVSELNLYCFQRGCYRYALYAPECLEKLLKRSDYIAISISDRQDSSTSEGFEKLLQCCENILEYSRIAPRSKRKEIVRFGKSFAKHEISRFRRKNRLIEMPLGDVKEEKESSEEEEPENEVTSGVSSESEAECEESSPDDYAFAEEDHEANLLAAARPFNRNACRICQEENCKRYLEEFVKQFSLGQMKYAPPTIQ